MNAEITERCISESYLLADTFLLIPSIKLMITWNFMHMLNNTVANVIT